jgi:hypothetical protein
MAIGTLIERYAQSQSGQTTSTTLSSVTLTT